MNDRDIARGRGDESRSATGPSGSAAADRLTEELERWAEEPMDAADLDLLDQVADLYEALDPTPEMLPELVLFGLQAVDLDAELARLVDAELAPAAAGARAVEQARRVTFSSEHLTVMIAASDRAQDTVRLDGWCTPGAGLRVDLRADDAVHSTVCDSDGRFAFDAVPRGMIQLTLSPVEGSDPGVLVPVITPAVRL